MMDYQWSMDIASERAYATPFADSPWLPLLLMVLASQKHSPNTKTEVKDAYDYIIVGAGSAGSVVASRLSEIPCVSVLLLEAGKPPPRLTEVPTIFSSFYDSDVDWQYKTTPQRYTAAEMKDRVVPWQSGKMLGGSSSLNGMVYTRGNRRNYDEWAALGAKGWSYDEVLPYFKKLEDNTDPFFLANGYHASGGPITASRPTYNPEKKMAAIDAVLDEGYRFVDPNARWQKGFYDYQMSLRKGQRCSTAKAYLVPSENRTNLDIVPNAMVRKVLIENKEAVGVEFDLNGLTRRVTARREVIVSAGTFNTPQLLMLSGIGPMSELLKHNIPLVADLPVGLHLQDHVMGVDLFYDVDPNLPRLAEEIKKESNTLEYINQRTGPLTSSGGSLLTAYLSTCDTDMNDLPDYLIYISDLLKTPPELEGQNRSFIACLVALAHPYSIGTVSLRSSDPYDLPEIDPNYLADFRDVQNMVDGFKKCKSIMDSPVLKRIGAKPAGHPMKGCEEYAGNEELYLRCLVRIRVRAGKHQVGTARMGDPKDPRTVVDPQLRVKGINKLRVVDASIMPTIPSNNINIPTIMVAEKASDIIKEIVQCGNPDPTIDREDFSMFPKIPIPWT